MTIDVIWENIQNRMYSLVDFRRYYKMQDELINAFENLHLDIDDAMENAETNLRTQRWADILSKLTFFCNLVSIVTISVFYVFPVWFRQALGGDSPCIV